MIDFLSVVLLVFGILQIILFFKIWGMTNDVREFREMAKKRPSEEEKLVIEAQVFALSGEFDRASKMYQNAFYLGVMRIFMKSVHEYGTKADYPERGEYYKKLYDALVLDYAKKMEKVNGTIDSGKFNSFDKVRALISNI